MWKLYNIKISKCNNKSVKTTDRKLKKKATNTLKKAFDNIRRK